MLSRRSATGREAGKAAGEGAPSQKTCRLPRPVPLAEGGNVFPRLLVPAVLAAIVLALAACGSGASETGAPASTATNAEARSEDFPVTIEAQNGPVVLKERPDRIVSLSPTATESLFAIGADDQVVAVDDQSNYPKEAPRTKLSGFEPNVEAIVGYEPDLVVVGFDTAGLVAALEKLHVPVLLQPAAKDLGDAYEQIDELGEATGHVGAAEGVVGSMKRRIDELRAAVPAGRRLSVYHELGPDFYSATSRTFIGSVYRLLGLENIADEAGGGAPDYPQLSAEYIVSSNPDLIVLSDTKCCGQTEQTVAKRPGWKHLSAVRTGHVLPVNDDIASRWGPRTVQFVRLVVGALEEIREQ
jgi:iron complex transport system substrate-binding protein